MKKYLPLFSVLAIGVGLMCLSREAAAGARNALSVCGATLAPSLLPFFTLSNLLTALGLPALLSGGLGRAVGRMFRVSPAGAQAFILGLSGGSPLGASVTALVSKNEGERLAAFCNNSGPAFILGAAGAVFQSPAAGLLLFVTHALGAATVGFLFRGKAVPSGEMPAPPPVQSFAKALPAAVGKAVSSTLAVCGYVVLFGA